MDDDALPTSSDPLFAILNFSYLCVCNPFSVSNNFFIALYLYCALMGSTLVLISHCQTTFPTVLRGGRKVSARHLGVLKEKQLSSLSSRVTR